MSAPLPFHVAPEAEQWLLKVSTAPEMQPGISYTLGYEAHNLDGELTEQFRGDHYSIGLDTPARWERAPGGPGSNCGSRVLDDSRYA